MVEIADIDFLVKDVLEKVYKAIKAEYKEELKLWEKHPNATMVSLRTDKRPLFGQNKGNLLWVDKLKQKDGNLRIHLQKLNNTPVGDYSEVDSGGYVKYHGGFGNCPWMKIYNYGEVDYVVELAKYAFEWLFSGRKG
ncbi:hypothetical protein KY366_04285 [Candidatus Woesearchaeota archaeon]|nr:hypothetical protein [Candidatus Woesearchaeota archaeon]